MFEVPLIIAYESLARLMQLLVAFVRKSDCWSVLFCSSQVVQSESSLNFITNGEEVTQLFTVSGDTRDALLMSSCDIDKVSLDLAINSFSTCIA